MLKSYGGGGWLDCLQDFSVSPSPFGTNLELIGTCLVQSLGGGGVFWGLNINS